MSGGGPPCGLLHPGMPAAIEPAEVLGVHGLLDEQVDLPLHAEHGTVLQPIQLLPQPQQRSLRHLVEAPAIAAHRQEEGGGQDDDILFMLHITMC